MRLKNNGWITVPWAEFVGRDGSHGSSFASGWDDGNQATFNIIVAWDDGPQAEEDILGVSVYSELGDRLLRTPPVQHPYKTQMRAERIISATPVQWTGKKSVDLPYGPGAGGNVGTLSTYAYWMLSIGFTVPKYTIMTDTDLQSAFGPNEWERWCEVKEIQHQETVTREAGSFVWDASAPAGLAGKPFVSPMGQHFYSSILEVMWRRVPRVGLYAEGGESDLLNENIRAMVGVVHNGLSDMWGISANPPYNNANANGSALRFVSYEVEPISSPFSPVTQDLTLGSPNTYHNVKFKFHVWDPPSGDGVNFGHNLAPKPTADGKWYLVKTRGGATIYPVGDVSQIFQLTTAVG